MTYTEFLKSKIERAPVSGFAADPAELSPALKPHQRDAVLWALRGGRRALFESFGLGKTVQELEFCRMAVKHTGGQALIVLPLGVRQEFCRDAVQLLDWEAPPPYVRTMEEVRQHPETPVLLTNYERVRDGDIDPAGAGHGLNLQDGGHIIVWFGPIYDLELWEQFIDRLHRQGQRSATTSVIVLVAEGTVELDAMQSLDAKEDGQASMMRAIRARIKKLREGMA